MTIPTVEAWQDLATKAGLTGEALAPGLARALEQHCSLETARQSGAAAVAALRIEQGRLTAEVAGLRQEPDGLVAAIPAVRDAGVARLREVGAAATAQVRAAGSQFERVQTLAAILRQHVRVAQALATGAPGAWAGVEPET